MTYLLASKLGGIACVWGTQVHEREAGHKCMRGRRERGPSLFQGPTCMLTLVPHHPPPIGSQLVTTPHHSTHCRCCMYGGAVVHLPHGWACPLFACCMSPAQPSGPCSCRALPFPCLAYLIAVSLHVAKPVSQDLVVSSGSVGYGSGCHTNSHPHARHTITLVPMRVGCISYSRPARLLLFVWCKGM